MLAFPLSCPFYLPLLLCSALPDFQCRRISQLWGFQRISPAFLHIRGNSACKESWGNYIRRRVNRVSIYQRSEATGKKWRITCPHMPLFYTKFRNKTSWVNAPPQPKGCIGTCFSSGWYLVPLPFLLP